GLRLAGALELVAVDERGADRGGTRAAAALEGGAGGEVLLDLGELGADLVEALEGRVVLLLGLRELVARGLARLALLADLLRLLGDELGDGALQPLDLGAERLLGVLVHAWCPLVRVSPKARRSSAMTAARSLVLRAFRLAA